MKHIMNKHYFAVTMVAGLMFFSACNRKDGNVQIEGKIDNLESTNVELKLLKAQEATIMDSATVDENFEFELTGQLDIPSFAALDFKNGDMIYLIVKPDDNITIQADGDDIANTYTIKGSNDSYKIKQLLTNHQVTLDKIADVIIAYRDSIEANSADAERLLAQRNKKRNELVDEHREYTKKFIKENLHSLASLMALYQSIGRNAYVLDLSKDYDYFAMVDSSLSKKYPSSDAVKDLNQLVVSYREQNKQLTIGQLAPDIALPSPDGDTVRLSSFRGSYVLLDFWASWCSPCRKENPYLVQAYDKFGGEEFEIYQVSLDKTKDAWMKGIQEDDLNWTHVSDLQFWNSQAARLYKVNQIPSNFLLNPDGEIIARNLRGKHLEKKLAEVLN